MIKLLKNRLFIVVSFFLFAIFAITVIIHASKDDNFLYHDEGDVFDVIDTLD